ncbi:unnamed protein product, partial [marine sediment metagenome]
HFLPIVPSAVYAAFGAPLGGKGADPTAQVGNGGIIQATSVRLEYLDTVWDEYCTRYMTDTMPVDVWNVHNFIFKEKCDDFGADIPPGCDSCDRRPSDGVKCYGEIYPEGDWTHASMDIFRAQIQAFRQWMKNHGQQDKPLIVSEYGIVYFHPWSEEERPGVTRDFMLATFDYFMNTKDANLGYSADDYRLVQRWAWYSLDDAYLSTGFNRYGVLIDRYSGQITPLGQAFADYAENYLDRP